MKLKLTRLAFGLAVLVAGAALQPTGSSAQALCKNANTCADAGAMCRAGNFRTIDCAGQEARCNSNGGIWSGQFVTCRVRGSAGPFAGPKPKRPR